MKKFKDFINDKEKIDQYPIIPLPTHGEHSNIDDKDLTIPLVPAVNHGKHALKEGGSHPETADSSEWANHNENAHLGQDVEDVHNKLNIPEHEFDAIPHSDRIHEYTSESRTLNQRLISKAKGQDPFHHSKFNHAYIPDSYKLATTEPEMKKIARFEKSTHNKKVKELDNSLKTKTLDHDLHVYHGTSSFNPDELARQHPQRKIKSAAYMSTSINKKKAFDFAKADPFEKGDLPYAPIRDGHVLHIHLKPGQHGMYVGDNSEFSSEKEFLLPRNTILQVHHEPTVTNIGTKIWHAHVVKR